MCVCVCMCVVCVCVTVFVACEDDVTTYDICTLQLAQNDIAWFPATLLHASAARPLDSTSEV